MQQVHSTLAGFNPLHNKRIVIFSIIILLMIGLASQRVVSQATSVSITPGIQWNDVASNIISAHGGGMTYLNGTYYWVGEYKDDNHTINSFMGHVTTQFVANTCYSSSDLNSGTTSHWVFVNNILTQQASGDLGPNNRVVERPKLIFNAATGTWVQWMHIDNNKYGEGKVGVATSPTICGNYTYLGSFQPLGNSSKDETVFLDTDGKGYLISGDHLNIYLMNSSFTNVTSLVATANPSASSEAPAMFKIGSTYYLFTSHKTWWTSNDNYYFTAPAISGPWTNQGDFTPGSTNTWNSQTAFVEPVTGTSGTTYMYMGDRWCENCFSKSYYIWLPLTINGTSVSMAWYATWNIDTATGLWTP